MQLRIACILRVIFIDSRRNSPCTEGRRSFIFVADTSRFCRVFRAESCCGFHHAGRVTVCFRTKSCGYIVRYFYRLSALVVQADCACRSRAAFSSGGSSSVFCEADNAATALKPSAEYPDKPSDSNSIFPAHSPSKSAWSPPVEEVSRSDRGADRQTKKDAFSSLGDSPVLRVKHSPGD